MKLTDKERNTCAALLCRWAARDNELMASDLYSSSQYYNFGKIMLDGMVYDVPEPKEEMENEDADDPPAQR